MQNNTYSVEIIDYYPENLDKKELFFKGTMKIFIPELGIELLNINVYQFEKGDYRFNFHYFKGFHHETKKVVRYPLLSFRDKNSARQIFKTLNKEGVKFMEKYMKEPIGKKLPPNSGEWITLPSLKSRNKSRFAK